MPRRISELVSKLLMTNLLQRLTSFVTNNYILENSEKPKCTVKGDTLFILNTIYKPEHCSVVVVEEISHDTSDIYITKIAQIPSDVCATTLCSE